MPIHLLLRLITVSILLFSPVLPAVAQLTVSGVVIASDGQSALPFVNIGIKGKNVGTMSQPEGRFSIVIPASLENDTLTLSMVGYEELYLPLKLIQQEELRVFHLTVQPSVMNEVSVSTGRIEEKSFGIKNNRLLIHLLDGSTNQDDIFEIAQLTKCDFVVSLEFIPSGTKNSPIYYELKLGSSSKSFVRTNSQCEWGVPFILKLQTKYKLYTAKII